MCCRFYVPSEKNKDYAEVLSSVKNSEALVVGREICPTDTVAVIANDKSLKPSAFAMKWGYSEYGRLIFNTRSETAGTKSVFRDGFLQRRCLIPALCYYEWDASKRKYRISYSAGGLILLAGIYRLEGSAPVFSILTKEPDDELRKIHDRMPVIIPSGVKDLWLSPSTNPGPLLDLSAGKLDIQNDT